MFEKLNQIFASPPLPRQTEEGDARLRMRRRKDDENRRRQHEREKDTEDTLEDRTTVSIDSLKIFLDNLVKSLSEKPLKSFEKASGRKEESAKVSPADQVEIIDSRKNKGENSSDARNPAAARAARAYARTATKNPYDEAAAAPRPEGGSDISNIGETLDREHIAMIRDIQGLLDKLKERQIDYIEITRENGFLESLKISCERYLAAS